MSLALAERHDWVALMQPAAELAKQLAGTEFVPESIRDSPAKIAACVLFGAEVGLGPMQSLARIAVIKGRPALAAETQRAMILREGHELWIEESTITRCTIAGRRRGSDLTSRVTWSIDDAKRANLAGGPAWRAYPRQMLLARASAELARAIFADAIGGMPAAEELDEISDNGTLPAALPAAPADAPTPTPAAKTRRRRSAPTPDPEPPQAQATVSEPPPPQPEPDPVDPATQPTRTEGQKRQIFALVRDVGLSSREERLEYTAAVIGREIGSSSELTIGEAATLIEALKELQQRKHNEQEVIETLETELDAKPEPAPYNEFPDGY